MNKGGMSGNKKIRHHLTDFYLETLLLAVVLTAVILILARVFAFSGEMSRRAGVLTGAVHLAENAAEAASASENLDTMRELLEENGNAEVFREGDGGILRVWYGEGMQPAAGGEYRVEISWRPGDALAESIVSVYWKEETEPVYTLETAVYLGEGAGA